MAEAAVVQHEFIADYQPLFTRSKYRYKVAYGGRGGTKSWAFARALLLIGYRTKVRVLCCREVLKSVKDSVHLLLSDQIEMMGLQDHYEVLQTEIRGKNGTTFFFEGLSRNIDNIKSKEAVDICWVEEAQSTSGDSWKKLPQTIFRKEKAEIWVTFNPDKKSDPVYQRFIVSPPEDAWVIKVGWQDNPWLTDAMHRERGDDYARDADEAAHIWEGELKEFAEGSIYGKQIKAAREDGRITSLPIQSREVHTFWDLGRNDHMAIWFMQEDGPWYNFIDYYESRLQDIDHYVRVLDGKDEADDGVVRDYVYGDHYMPHDAEQTVLGSGNRSRKEIFEDEGLSPVIVVPRISHVNDGIALTRKILPQCRFDEDRCAVGLDALSQYQYVYDEEFQRQRNVPLHNWASNGADAFRQFAQGFEGRTGWRQVLESKDDMSDRRRKAVSRNQVFKQDQSWRT